MSKAREVVEHLFRHESGHIKSRLIAKYGMLHLSEIEDAVSDALIRAMKTWTTAVPESPPAWLYTVSSRILIDTLRRKKLYYEKVIPTYTLSSSGDDDMEDEYATIKLMLWCAHPSLPAQDQLGLILQLVSGFSIKEISSALLLNVESLKKRLQRARAKIKAIESELQLPKIAEVEDRFPTLRSALYLGFNEGYYSIHQEEMLREDLIYESLRLCHMVCHTPHKDIGISQALMSLMLYHTSRIPARRSADNSFVLFENQDRTLWDQQLIRLASSCLEKSMESDYYTPYHIEAVIAGIHTQTDSYADTDWKTITTLYKKLMSVTPNPIVELNYTYALLMADHMEAAHQLLTHRDPESLGAHSYLFYAVFAFYYRKKKDKDQQKLMLWKAIDAAPNDITRKVLKDRLKSVFLIA